MIKKEIESISKIDLRKYTEIFIARDYKNVELIIDKFKEPKLQITHQGGGLEYLTGAPAIRDFLNNISNNL